MGVKQSQWSEKILVIYIWWSRHLEPKSVVINLLPSLWPFHRGLLYLVLMFWGAELGYYTVKQ